MHFATRLHDKVQSKKSPLCVGLDPHWEKIPDHIKAANQNEVKAIEQFLCAIIEGVKDHCACVKPNLAFFEVWGADGWSVLEKVSLYAKQHDLEVIADAKRNDIGSTAAKYAEAFLGADKPYDALTITPYLGSDGILPFQKIADTNVKGLFALCKTSNPSSGEIQDLIIGDTLLHEEMGRMISRWGSVNLDQQNFSSLGAVVGATYADEMRILRREMPGQVFLIPGYGAQGGSAADVKPAFYKNGTGAIINSSRGILFASEGQDFAEKAGEAARKSAEELWEVATA